jgi:hypothetical protein
MPYSNETDEIYTQNTLNSGSKDLNLPSEDFWSTYDNTKWLDEDNTDSEWSSSWYSVNQFLAINGTNATNTTAAKRPVYASGC